MSHIKTNLPTRKLTVVLRVEYFDLKSALVRRHIDRRI